MRSRAERPAGPQQRRWPQRVLFECAAALLAALLCVALGWGLSWLGLAGSAAKELRALAQGSSPLRFDFRDTGQLIGRRAEGATALTASSEGLVLTLGPSGVNAGLNFRGRELDLQRFPDLRLVLDSSAAGRLSLIVEDRSGARHATVEAVPLVAGLNPLRIDLAAQRWRREQVGSAPAGPATEGPPRRILTLRLYIAAAAQTEVVLREARFYAAAAATAQVVLDPLLAPPEHWLGDAERVRADSPDIVVLPPHLHRPLAWPGLLWPLLAVGVAALVCTAALLWHRRQGAPALRAVGCWALLAFPVLALWIGDDPSWALLGFAVGAALIGVQKLPPGPTGTSVWRASLEALVVTLAVLLVLAVLPGVQWTLTLPDRSWVYLLWALLQQVVLQRVLYARLRRTVDPQAAAWWCAAGFALWHAPNLSLMLLTLVGGRLWCGLYERGGHLAPLVVSHTLIGWMALQWLHPHWLRSAEVSARFLGL